MRGAMLIECLFFVLIVWRCHARCVPSSFFVVLAGLWRPDLGHCRTHLMDYRGCDSSSVVWPGSGWSRSLPALQSPLWVAKWSLPVLQVCSDKRSTVSGERSPSGCSALTRTGRETANHRRAISSTANALAIAGAMSLLGCSCTSQTSSYYSCSSYFARKSTKTPHFTSKNPVARACARVCVWVCACVGVCTLLRTSTLTACAPENSRYVNVWATLVASAFAIAAR